MRKFLLALAALVLTAVVVAAGATALMRRDNTSRKKRAEALMQAIQQLRVGASDFGAATLIAAKFGNAPPPRQTNYAYQKENCAAENHLEDCTYVLEMNNNPLVSMWSRYPSMRVLRVEDWLGYAMISVRNNRVVHYSYWIRFKSAAGKWRLVGAEEGLRLPLAEIDARMSSSYSVHYDYRNEGFEASITPTATDAERQRALHLDLTCTAKRQGCLDVCEVMPEAARDFYEMLDRPGLPPMGYREAVFKKRLLCNTPPN